MALSFTNLPSLALLLKKSCGSEVQLYGKLKFVFLQEESNSVILLCIWILQDKKWLWNIWKNWKIGLILHKTKSFDWF
jgi:hypothetical protein